MSDVMRNVDVRDKRERLTDKECRALYNKLVAKMSKKGFRMKADDTDLKRLRECERYLREMSYYEDLINSRQIKEGQDEQIEDMKEKAKAQKRKNEKQPIAECKRATERGDECENNED